VLLKISKQKTPEALAAVSGVGWFEFANAKSRPKTFRREGGEGAAGVEAGGSPASPGAFDEENRTGHDTRMSNEVRHPRRAGVSVKEARPPFRTPGFKVQRAGTRLDCRRGASRLRGGSIFEFRAAVPRFTGPFATWPTFAARSPLRSAFRTTSRPSLESGPIAVALAFRTRTVTVARALWSTLAVTESFRAGAVPISRTFRPAVPFTGHFTAAIEAFPAHAFAEPAEATERSASKGESDQFLCIEFAVFIAIEFVEPIDDPGNLATA
jgi:hypothetical protein